MSLVDPEDALRKMNGESEDEDTKDVPPKTVITLDVKGSRQRYQGRFLFTVPNIGDQIKIGQLKSIYLPQGSAADANAATICDVVAFLTVCITFDDAHPKPAWWNPMRAYDVTPYSELYGRCLDYEATFHGKNEKRGPAQERVREEQDDAGDGSAPVGRKVQTPPKRREALTGDDA